MPLAQSIAAFLVAGGLLTVTPGLDTVLVLRTAAGEGRRAAALAVLGIQLGCLTWGAAVALGLGVLLTASAAAYLALKWCGAAYLVWLGIGLLRGSRDTLDLGSDRLRPAAASASTWLRRGLLTNLLNPKIGVFYVSFLPQFVPDGFAPSPAIFGFAVLHVVIGTLWLATLILGMSRLRPLLRRPATIRWLDRLTGTVFIGFGLKLALGRR